MVKNYTTQEKELYLKELNLIWSTPRMYDYELKQLSGICTLYNGDYIVFEKHGIQTNFCFDDSYDYEGALSMADHARKSEEYFINENMKYLNERIEKLLDDRFKVVAYKKYFKQPDECKLRNYTYMRQWEDIDPRLTDARELDREERQLIVDALIKEKEAFAKRLNTYLKRYGLTKVNSWTFWGMA